MNRDSTKWPSGGIYFLMETLAHPGTENQEKHTMQRPRSFLMANLAAAVIAATALTASPVAAQDTFELAGDAAAIWNLAGSVSISGGGSVVTVAARRGGSGADRLEIQTGPIDLDGGVGRVSSLRVVYPGDEIMYAGGGERRGARA